MHLRVRRRLLSMAIAISLLPLPVAAVRLHRLLLLPVEILLPVWYEEENMIRGRSYEREERGVSCVARFIYLYLVPIVSYCTYARSRILH